MATWYPLPTTPARLMTGMLLSPDFDTDAMAILYGPQEGIWRTRDGGQTWGDQRRGLPQENAFFGVLRQALTTDRLDPAGVYFGTGSGTLYASVDEGDSWTWLAQHLPSISSVETLVIDAE